MSDLAYENRISLYQSVSLVLKGMITGTGAILPGVSGGVLCMAFGIYEPLMQVLSDPGKNLKKHLYIFLPFAAGWVLGFILLAGAAEKLFAYAPAAALMLFAGMILGTIPKLLKEAGSENRYACLWALISFTAFLIFFRFMTAGHEIQIEPNVFWYAFSGMVWGLSLIIPGLSSSSFLILLGLYQPMTAGIASLDLSVIVPLAAGLSVTVLLLAKTVSRLLEGRRGIMLALISGIMAASAACMIPEMTGSEIIPALLSLAAGFAVSLKFQ